MDDILLAGAAGFILFLCFFGGLFFQSPYEDAPDVPRHTTSRVYVYDVIEGEWEYTVDDAPVALLEAHDA